MRKNFNYPLFFLVIFLVGFGFLFITLLSGPISLKRFGNTTHYSLHQLFFGVVPAIAAGVITYKIPLKFIKKWSLPLFLLNMLAMFLVFLPKIGFRIGGANRWLNFGNFAVQPSEFLKITAILYLSAWISSKLSETKVNGWRAIIKRSSHNIIYILLPFLVFLGLIFIALFLQKDAGTLGIIALTLLVIYFSSKTPFWHTLLIISLGMGAFFFLIWFTPYRLQRLMIFLNPNQDPLGAGYQLNQSLISLGSGGFFGKGLGMSIQKFGFFLPQATSDLVFAIFGEELGFVGCLILVLIFIFLFYLGLKISRNAKDSFSKMTALGIACWLTFQAFINMASTIGALPLTGIPLPFFSYGGSHLIVELIGIGLLLNISKNS